MNGHKILLWFVLALSSFLRRQVEAFMTRAGGSDKPNILFITTDQQRTDTLKSYGSTFARSPNIDRLAREGARFEHAVSAGPSCMPARASWLFGVHVPVHGVLENNFDTHRNWLVPYSDLLEKEGYYTGIVGKVHFKPTPSSFKVVVQETGMKGPGLRESEYLETYLVNKTMDLINKTRRDHPDMPWFFHLSMLSPHGPRDPPIEWKNVMDDVVLPDVDYRTGDLDKLSKETKMLVGAEAAKKDVRTGHLGDLDQRRKDYYSLMSYVDHQVGRMIDFLDLEGLSKNTLVIFTSDHGDMLWDHGIPGKHSFKRSSWSVPLILRWPGTIPQNQTNDFAVGVDVTTTILAAAQVSKRQTHGYSGFDLLSNIRLGRPSPRKIGIGALYQGFALTTKRLKLEYFPTYREARLYDLMADPSERTNYFGEPGYEKISTVLLQELLSWRAQLDSITFLRHSHVCGETCKHFHADAKVVEHTAALRARTIEEELQERVLHAEEEWVKSRDEPR